MAPTGKVGTEQARYFVPVYPTTAALPSPVPELEELALVAKKEKE
jgi:hypothetical protein